MSIESEAGIVTGQTETAIADTATSSVTETSHSTPVTPSPAEAAAPADVTPGFDSFGLSPTLMQAITEAGYKTPTPIQAQGIPNALARRDLIGIAQTGTGKTASFALPMIELLSRGRAKARMPRSLILEPTRELAAQVAESFDQYTKYNKLSMALLIGGVSFEDQDRKLDRGADILIATPGRLLDHFERGKLMLSQVQILVVDEADRMLDMGFIPDVERICKLIPFTRQTLFYSATMPTEIRRLTEQFLQNPVRIEVARPATTASTITQTLVEVPANDWAKREALRRLIREAGEIKNAIVFCNRKHDVDIVARSLKKHEFNAAPLHGDLDQSLRMKTLDAFRSGELQILVASDVAARGLDIPDVSHVFNFDVPFHSDDYVHRIGRTGRAGRLGAAFMLITPRDGKYVEAIEKLTKTTLERRVLEGLADAVQDRPARPDRDRKRSRGRDHDRNKHEYPIKPHGQVAAMEPAKPQGTPVAKPAAQPRAENPAQRPPRHEDQRHKERYEQRAGTPRYAEQRQEQRSQEPRRKYDPRRPFLEPEKPDISQLPAFLLRPVPLPKSPEKKEPVKKEAAPKENTKAKAPPKVSPTVTAPTTASAPAPVAAPTEPVAPVISAQTVTSPVTEALAVVAPVIAEVTPPVAPPAAETGTASADEPAVPKKRTRRKAPVKKASGASAEGDAATAEGAAGMEPAEKPAKKPRAPRRKKPTPDVATD